MSGLGVEFIELFLDLFDFLEFLFVSMSEFFDFAFVVLHDFFSELEFICFVSFFQSVDSFFKRDDLGLMVLFERLDDSVLVLKFDKIFGIFLFQIVDIPLLGLDDLFMFVELGF